MNRAKIQLCPFVAQILQTLQENLPTYTCIPYLFIDYNEQDRCQKRLFWDMFGWYGLALLFFTI